MIGPKLDRQVAVATWAAQGIGFAIASNLHAGDAHSGPQNPKTLQRSSHPFHHQPIASSPAKPRFPAVTRSRS